AQPLGGVGVGLVRIGDRVAGVEQQHAALGCPDLPHVCGSAAERAERRRGLVVAGTLLDRLDRAATVACVQERHLVLGARSGAGGDVREPDHAAPARAEQQTDDDDDSEIGFHDGRPGRAYYGREGKVSTGWSVHPWVAEGQRRVRFGVCLGPRSDWARLLAFAETAERAGLDSYWALDHPMGGTDCWTLLAALAVRTEHLRLGTLVDCVYYRSPAMLARLAADVDRLSGGRLILGLGIGDAEREFAQMGLTYPD